MVVVGQAVSQAGTFNRTIVEWKRSSVSVRAFPVDWLLTAPMLKMQDSGSKAGAPAAL